MKKGANFFAMVVKDTIQTNIHLENDQLGAMQVIAPMLRMMDNVDAMSLIRLDYIDAHIEIRRSASSALYPFNIKLCPKTHSHG